MITDFPLVAITDVLDAPSVDAQLDPTWTIMQRKLDDVLGTQSWKDPTDPTYGSGYGWTVDTVIEQPIQFKAGEAGEWYWGHHLTDEYHGVRIMGNGHHRLAFQIYVQGALFVHYSEDNESEY